MSIARGNTLLITTKVFSRPLRFVYSLRTLVCALFVHSTGTCVPQPSASSFPLRLGLLQTTTKRSFSEYCSLLNHDLKPRFDGAYIYRPVKYMSSTCTARGRGVVQTRTTQLIVFLRLVFLVIRRRCDRLRAGVHVYRAQSSVTFNSHCWSACTETSWSVVTTVPQSWIHRVQSHIIPSKFL